MTIQAENLRIYPLTKSAEGNLGIALNADPTDEDIVTINKQEKIRELHLLAQAAFSKRTVEKLHLLLTVVVATFVAQQPEALFYKLPNLEYLELS